MTQTEKWPMATDQASIDRRFQEYLERHDAYYPDRPRMLFDEFVTWDRKWVQTYEALWDQVNEYLNLHGYTLEFSKAPQWPRIVELETRLCV